MSVFYAFIFRIWYLFFAGIVYENKEMPVNVFETDKSLQQDRVKSKSQPNSVFCSFIQANDMFRPLF